MIGFGGLNLPGDRYIDPRYRLANALMAGSVQRSPDTHWMQGLGRMSQMLAGAYLASEADRAGQRDQDELYKILGSTEPKVQGPDQGPVSALPSAPQQPGGRWGRAMQNLLGGVNEYIQETPNQVASARNMLGQGINEINAAPEAQEPAGIGGGGSGTVLPDIKATAFAMPEFKRTRDDFILEKLRMAAMNGGPMMRAALAHYANKISERDARREDMMAQMRFQMGMKEDDRAYRDLVRDDERRYQERNKERKKTKAGDGFYYWDDTGERVFPDVKRPSEDRKTLQGADKRHRYIDTGELVFPDLAAPSGADPKDEQNIRKEYNQLTRDYRQVRDSFGRIIASSEDPSAAGDLALIFNYMKVLDPGSTVREGEFATAQNSAGVPDQVRSFYNRIMNGKRLSDAQRLDFVDRAKKLYDQQEVFYKNTRDTYLGLAGQYGMAPDRVAPDFSQGLPEYVPLTPEQQAELDALRTEQGEL